MFKKLAFTLAEVLLTLVIIGVVAAITVPTIIANSKDEEIRSLLKKNHSIIAQALHFYYLDYGINLKGNDYFEPYTFKNIFKTHFNVIKDSNSYLLRTAETYKNYNGTSFIEHHPFNDGQFVLSDGSFIMIENPNSSEKRIFISVDVNGYGKKPNRLGKDLFMFQINNEGKLLPMGAKGTFYSVDEYCSKSSSDSMNGAGCTVKMLQKHK